MAQVPFTFGDKVFGDGDGVTVTVTVTVTVMVMVTLMVILVVFLMVVGLWREGMVMQSSYTNKRL